MKIAFYFEASNKDGGILKHQLKQAEILNNIKIEKDYAPVIARRLKIANKDIGSIYIH